ncbi:MAG TPA: hypothetical protein VE075_06775 [Thermoanaerobaculia bacterium]|nr:hypothetical protein [Thermoanaerobaculia bacterium]
MPNSQSGVVVRRGMTVPLQALSDAGPYDEAPGGSKLFRVFYQKTLPAGPRLAADLLASCDTDFATLKGWFGVTPGGLPFKVYLESGDFGAYHKDCATTEIHCSTFDGSDRDAVRMLVTAEAVEVFAAALGKGWDCGTSDGEGLSRVLATAIYKLEIRGRATAPAWLQQVNRPDYVSKSDPSDGNPIALGCATLFLNFLHFQLGHRWQEIIQQGDRDASGKLSLATTYQRLTGKDAAFGPFNAALAQAYPPGRPVFVSSDNVFPLPQGAVQAFLAAAA